MDPTQPLNLVPQAPSPSPYTAPNNPYQQQSSLGTVIAALKAVGQGAAAGQQQGAGGGTQPSTQSAGQSNTPNYNQLGQNAVGGMGNLLNLLGGQSASFGGGNLMSGDAFGGSAVMPLPGLSAADYG